MPNSAPASLSPCDAHIWGNGAAFDNVVLASAFRATGMQVPWAFWNDRCYRTVKSLFSNVKLKRSGTHHNALDDAVTQAKHLLEIAEHYGWNFFQD